MAQLKMYWLGGSPLPELIIPDEYHVSTYKSKKDRMPWVECCKNGLVDDDADEGVFISRIARQKDIKMKKDVIFLDCMGEHIGTVTAIFHKKENIGHVHMVGIRQDFRGKGLGKVLNALAVHKLDADGVKWIYLTTDEWRKSAVKSYLTAGFLPVEYDTGMKERWEKVLAEYGISQCDMVFENGTFCRTLHAKID